MTSLVITSAEATRSRFSSPWLLVRTPTGFGPKPRFQIGREQPTHVDVTEYFWYFLFILLGVCVLYFYDLSAWDGCWSLVSIWSIIYKFLNVCPISIARLLREVGRLGARKPINHTSWVADVTPTDRLKSVRNRCVIDHFCDVFVYFHIWWYPACMEVCLILLGQISFLF